MVDAKNRTAISAALESNATLHLLPRVILESSLDFQTTDMFLSANQALQIGAQ